MRRFIAALTPPFAALALAAAAAPAAIIEDGQCPAFFDGSGSGTDESANREWLLNEAVTLVEAFRSSAPGRSLLPAVFDEEVRVLDPGPAPAGTAGPDSTQIRSAIDSALRTGKWTNPLAALETALGLVDVKCVIVVTDGSIDPGPALDGPDYYQAMYSRASELGSRGTPVVVVALHDDAGGVWQEVSSRSGGAYLLDPDADTLVSVLADLAGGQTPVATTHSVVTASPRRTSQVPGPTGAPPLAPSTTANSKSVIGAVAAVTAAVVASGLAMIVVVATRRRPRLTGCLVLSGPGGDVVVELSRYRGSVSLGSRGVVRVCGDDVQQQHASIASAFDHAMEVTHMVVRPIDGEVLVARGARVIPVRGECVLEDNDRVILGRVEARFSLLLPVSG